MKLITRTFGFLVCVGLLATAANADSIIYDNISEATVGADPIAPPGAGVGPIYNSFSTGATAFTVTDVKLLLEVQGGMTGTVDVGLYSDSGNTTPGALLDPIGTVADTSLGFDPSVVDFSGLSLSLAAGTLLDRVEHE